MRTRLGPRPAIHLAPPTGWLNDPNGLCWHDGTWHAFHQWHPASDEWGPMHWGHATSTDLATWHHHGIALRPEPIGTAYSGSIVVDHTDTAGYGAGAWIAVHTRHSDDAEVQCLAVSTDDGATWTMATQDSGVVLRSPAPDFRDPKVFWWHDHWVMVLAVGDHCEVHVSPDLHTWSHTDDIAMPPASNPWECPDLVPVGDHHVLLACTSRLDGSGGTIALPGAFDGERFDPSKPAARVDLGPDFYAWQSVHGVTDRVVGMAWLNSWVTALDHPSTGWRGALTVPREIGEGHRAPVRAWPARELLDHPCVHHGVERLILTSDSGARATVTVGNSSATIVRDVPGVASLSTLIEVPIDPSAARCVVADPGSLEVFLDDGDVTVSLALPAAAGWAVEAV